LKVIISLQPIANINLKNLSENYDFIKNKVGKCKVFGVVKANAYGHGIVQVAKLLSDKGIDGFCVALQKEIDVLCDNGISKPILHLGKFSYSNLINHKKNVIVTINTVNDINNIQKFFIESGKSIKAHIKFDTGMGRMGFKSKNANEIFLKVSESKGIDLQGVYTHFSSSEIEDSKHTIEQRKKFEEIIKVSKIYYNNLMYHVSNSGGIFSGKLNYYNMVRPGITLYGVSPSGKSNKFLKPVMHFCAPVVLKKKIYRGESVGYNQTFIADDNIEIAIIQAGYADGVPFEFSNNGFVYWNKVKLPIIGKVSMDLFAVNCSNIDIKIGDKITIWGSNDFRIEHITSLTGKHPYLFLVSVSSRVGRKYV
jgi:alanine racemase